jgi:hypothetical protein
MQKELVTLQGFTRVKIGEEVDGKLKIVGDSGWRGPNEVVNLGFQDYICKSIGDLTGKVITHAALGTGTAPGAADTALEGETGDRETTLNSVESSKTLQATAEWASGDHPGDCTLQNVGLFNTSSGGTMLCGNTYAQSSWGSNQAVSMTYQLRFQTTT